MTARAIGTALIIASTPCCGATDTITVEVRGDGPSVRIEAPKNLRITGSYEAWTVRWDALSGASYYRLRGTTPNGSEVIEEVTGTSSRSGNAPSGSSVCVAGVGSEGVGPESCIVFGGDTYESDPDVVEREPQQDSPLRTGPVGANEPSGFRAFTQRSFASRSENGWRFWEGNGGRFDILSDSGALHGSTVGRITFPAGMGSTKPAETLFTSLKTPELYLRFRIKVSSNWRGHVSGVNKVLYLTDATAGGSGDPGVFVLDGSGSSPLRPQIRLQNPTLTPGAVNYSQNVGNRPIERGRWHDVEILLRYNTAGSRSDGQAHVWVDGTKVIQYNNIRWASGGALSWDAVRWEPYWGGQGDTLDRTQYMYMDYIHVSGK